MVSGYRAIREWRSLMMDARDVFLQFQSRSRKKVVEL